MTGRKLALTLRRFERTHTAAQVALLILGWWLADLAVRRTGFPLPSPVVGLFAVLALLLTKAVSVRALGRGAGFLIGEMLLFFVPAVLAVSAHPEFIGILGLKILAVILGGTLAVMATTAVTVEVWCRTRRRGRVGD